MTESPCDSGAGLTKDLIMSKFKVGDKIYCPYYGTSIFIVSTNSYNEDLNKYPFAVGAKTFTVHGKSDEYGILQEIFHATPENHALLEQLYGVEFEAPPVKPTSKEIIQAMLDRGDICVCCWVSDCVENPTAQDAWECILGCSSGQYTFITHIGSWKYATPFNPRTGKPITELPT